MSEDGCICSLRARLRWDHLPRYPAGLTSNCCRPIKQEKWGYSHVWHDRPNASQEGHGATARGAEQEVREPGCWRVDVHKYLSGQGSAGRVLDIGRLPGRIELQKERQRPDPGPVVPRADEPPRVRTRVARLRGC